MNATEGEREGGKEGRREGRREGERVGGREGRRQDKEGEKIWKGDCTGAMYIHAHVHANSRESTKQIPTKQSTLHCIKLCILYYISMHTISVTLYMYVHVQCIVWEWCTSPHMRARVK